MKRSNKLKSSICIIFLFGRFRLASFRSCNQFLEKVSNIVPKKIVAKVNFFEQSRFYNFSQLGKLKNV